MMPRKMAVKGILKKESDSPNGSNTSLSSCKKAVSWCDMNRWSEGSEADLDTLAARARRARSRRNPRKNFNWEGGVDVKSKSSLSLSELNKQLHKYKAPTKPLRQTSTELQNTKNCNAPNPFTAAVADFQNTLAREASSAPNPTNTTRNYKPPTKPLRVPSTELTKPNPFQDAVADFQTTLVSSAISGTSAQPCRRGSDEADPALMDEYVATTAKASSAPKRPNRRQSSLADETPSLAP